MLAVTLISPCSIKALVLGMGESCTNKFPPFFGINCENCQLDRFTCFSQGTLVTPEIAPLALMASPFEAFGLIKVKRRRK